MPSCYPAQDARDALGVPFMTNGLMAFCLQLPTHGPEAASLPVAFLHQGYGLLLPLVLQEGLSIFGKPPLFSRRNREEISPPPALSPYRASTDLLPECNTPKFVPVIVPIGHRESQKITDNHRYMEDRKSLDSHRIMSISRNLQEYSLFP